MAERMKDMSLAIRASAMAMLLWWSLAARLELGLGCLAALERFEQWAWRQLWTGRWRRRSRRRRARGLAAACARAGSGAGMTSWRLETAAAVTHDS